MGECRIPFGGGGERYRVSRDFIVKDYRTILFPKEVTPSTMDKVIFLNVLACQTSVTYPTRAGNKPEFEYHAAELEIFYPISNMRYFAEYERYGLTVGYDAYRDATAGYCFFR